MSLPKFQNSHTVSEREGTFYWGNKLSSKAPNYAKEFQDRFITNNSISLAGGNDNICPISLMQMWLPNGIMPKNDYMSHNRWLKLALTCGRK